jgi:hypothetical protein
MNDFQFDPELIDAYLAGGLDAKGEAVVADQIARVLPLHAAAPNPIAAALSRLIGHLGGERELLAWLERHPGRPRLVARLYVLMGLLDQISDEPAVVDALSELRARVPYPPGLEGYLVPDTTPDALADLAAKIEGLLTVDRPDEAFRLALATTAMLQEVAPRVAGADPQLRSLPDALEQVRRDLIAAAAGE